MKLIRAKWLWGWRKAFTIYPFIFHKNKEIEGTSLLAHEAWHYYDQKFTGTITWLLRYLFSKLWRYHMELEATAAEAWFVAKEKGLGHSEAVFLTELWTGERWHKRYRVGKVSWDHEHFVLAAVHRVRVVAMYDAEVGKHIGF